MAAAATMAAMAATGTLSFGGGGAFRRSVRISFVPSPRITAGVSLGAHWKSVGRFATVARLTVTNATVARTDLGGVSVSPPIRMALLFGTKYSHDTGTVVSSPLAFSSVSFSSSSVCSSSVCSSSVLRSLSSHALPISTTTTSSSSSTPSRTISTSPSPFVPDANHSTNATAGDETFTTNDNDTNNNDTNDDTIDTNDNDYNNDNTNDDDDNLHELQTTVLYDTIHNLVLQLQAQGYERDSPRTLIQRRNQQGDQYSNQHASDNDTNAIPIPTRDWVRQQAAAPTATALRSLLVSTAHGMDHICECLHYDFLWDPVSDDTDIDDDIDIGVGTNNANVTNNVTNDVTNTNETTKKDHKATVKTDPHGV